MKFTKTLASIAAAAIAVSSLAVSAFAGSITFSDDAWWTQKDLKIEDILEGNKPEDVESITFTSDTTFFLGYNSTKVTDEKTGSTWKQDATAADTYTVSDAVLAAQEIEGNTVNPAFSVMLSKGDGVDYTINWKVNLKNNEPAKPKPIQTKAEISYVDATTPSYSYTVKGDIDTLNVDVALSAEATEAGSGWNDWCGAGVAVTNPDGTVKYYQWGGAGVTWSWDVDGDKVDDSIDGVNGKTWVGTVGADGGQLSIPVVKGAVVDFYCLSWDSYNGVQYTLTINDEEAAVKPGETEDPTKPGETEDPTKPGETEDPTKPGETEDPAEPGESSGDVVNPGECSGEPVNPPTGAAVAVIPAALAAAAVATTGIVLKKRSK
ncbi:hypothetical protein NQ549_11495 [[Eubacterium] siraeum]|nr:hypothetical protein NQ549_11495 [[Eubacterium] siraeum]